MNLLKKIMSFLLFLISINAFAGNNYILSFYCSSKMHTEEVYFESIYFESICFKQLRVDKKAKTIYEFIDILAKKYHLVYLDNSYYLYRCCEFGSMKYPKINEKENDSIISHYLNLRENINDSSLIKHTPDLKITLNGDNVVEISIWTCDLDYCLCKPFYLGYRNKYQQVLFVKKMINKKNVDDDTKKDVLKWIKKSFARWRIKNVVIN